MAEDLGDGVVLLTTAQWGATSINRTFATAGARGIVLHHTVTPNTRPGNTPAEEQDRASRLARSIQKSHMSADPERGKRAWLDSGHHFLVSRGGVVLEGRHGSWDAASVGRVPSGAHAGNREANRHYYGIEIEGTYDASYELTDKQERAVIELCARLCGWGSLDPSYMRPHKHFKPSTKCPGTILGQLPRLRARVAERMRAITEDAELQEQVNHANKVMERRGVRVGQTGERVDRLVWTPQVAPITEATSAPNPIVVRMAPHERPKRGALPSELSFALLEPGSLDLEVTDVATETVSLTLKGRVLTALGLDPIKLASASLSWNDGALRILLAEGPKGSLPLFGSRADAAVTGRLALELAPVDEGLWVRLVGLPPGAGEDPLQLTIGFDLVVGNDLDQLDAPTDAPWTSASTPSHWTTALAIDHAPNQAGVSGRQVQVSTRSSERLVLLQVLVPREIPSGWTAAPALPRSQPSGLTWSVQAATDLGIPRLSGTLFEDLGQAIPAPSIDLGDVFAG